MEYALSLGSNLGDRLANLEIAKNTVLQQLTVKHFHQSYIYETAPVGVKDEYKDLFYLNAVLVINTDKSPAAVSQIIHSIEADMGRIRTEDRFAPRTIDIDILYAGDIMSDNTDLTLPHPRWSERRFVAQPLADINPSLILPNNCKTVAEILESLPQEPAVNLFTKNW
jgi:2-amino-4-hydroxy-6-hydroxymethyldihydropteridine diphosphokinase